MCRGFLPTARVPLAPRPLANTWGKAPDPLCGTNGGPAPSGTRESSGLNARVVAMYGVRNFDGKELRRNLIVGVEGDERGMNVGAGSTAWPTAARGRIGQAPGVFDRQRGRRASHD